MDDSVMDDEHSAGGSVTPGAHLPGSGDGQRSSGDFSLPKASPDMPGTPGDGRFPGGSQEPRADGTGSDAPPPPDTQTEAAGEGPDGKKPRKQPKPKKRGSFLRELPILIVIALALALVIKTYGFQAYFIPTGSMQNTLAIGDKVLVNKIVYHLRSIHRGDIIVFNGQGSWNPGPAPKTPNPADRLYHAIIGLFGAPPGQTDYIKRVIGLPGDHVRCCNAQGLVTVNGVALHETSYLFPGNSPSTTPFDVTVPAGQLWVMGDHRLVSYDSRGHQGFPGGGSIPEKEVVGRAFWIVWPPSRWRVLNIPSTFEQPALNNSKPSADGRQSPTATLTAALDSGMTIPVVPTAPALPLAAGLAGAIPLTWAQRRLRKRLRLRLAHRQ
jgi:signal peptidase I